MKKEQVESIIRTLIHQNLTVVNKGTDEHPDYVVGGTNDLQRELMNLYEHLELVKKNE